MQREVRKRIVIADHALTIIISKLPVKDSEYDYEWVEFVSALNKVIEFVGKHE